MKIENILVSFLFLLLTTVSLTTNAEPRSDNVVLPAYSQTKQIQIKEFTQKMKIAPTTRFGGVLTVGGSGLGFQCTGLHCSCNGDDDCNDMFTTNVCGDIAQCYEDSDGSVRCECLRI
jgi:hypothetical protein